VTLPEGRPGRGSSPDEEGTEGLRCGHRFDGTSASGSIRMTATSS